MGGKCWCSSNSMCFCVLGCMLACSLYCHVLGIRVGLCLLHVFRAVTRHLPRACPNTATPCFRTFAPDQNLAHVRTKTGRGLWFSMSGSAGQQFCFLVALFGQLYFGDGLGIGLPLVCSL